MRNFLLIILLLICNIGCEKLTQTNLKSFELTMSRRIQVGPCNQYFLKIESNGKAKAERSCTDFVECENYESNGISTEKRRCPKSETVKFEKQLSAEEITKLSNELEKAKFFSYKEKYTLDSGNCSQGSTDTPNVVLTVKTDEREKTVHYEYGCFVKDWFSNENALQPLINFENKINQTIGIENWTKGQK